MTKVTFQCVRSGNRVSFTNENDIAGLRKHEGYREISDVTPVVEESVKEMPKQMKRGRPSKIPAFLQE